MDAAQIAALAAVLAALPSNAFLIIVIILLWRRLVAVTDLLINAQAAKTDDSTKLAPGPAPETLPAE